MIDLDAAISFVVTHGRLLERRRLDLHLNGGDGAAVDAALDAYRNPDGGYGWALEPDQRSAVSQPVGALHAFEILTDVADLARDRAVALCDWLDTAALEGGALPFSTAGADAPGTAPWWAHSSTSEPSLHITAAVCGAAHRLSLAVDAVADHPWVVRATAWSLDAIERAAGRHPAYELRYVLDLLDAMAMSDPSVEATMQRLVTLVPADWRLPVEGGVADEALRPLTVTKHPDTALRRLVPPSVIDTDLDVLVTEQRADGGWTVDFAPVTDLAAIEWRGIATVDAVVTLQRHGRLPV